MTLNIPNSISNATPADAVEVEENFNVVEQYINTEVILRDGTVAMSGALILPASQSASDYAAIHNAHAIATFVNAAGDTMTGPLILPTTQSTDAAAAVHKTYVDDKFVELAGDTMTGALTLSGAPASSLHAATKAYVDTGDDARVAVTGDTMTGDLTVRGITVSTTGISLPAGEPSASHRAARKDYIDDNFVANTGDTMTGQLTVGTGSGSGDPFDGLRGAALHPNGVLGTLRSTNGTNMQAFKAGSAFTTGAHYAAFCGQTLSTVLCTITMTSGSSADIFPSSDRRLKERTGGVDDALDLVTDLGRLVYRGRWIADEGQGEEFVFLNAQDVGAVAPFATQGEPDGVDDDGNIIPMTLSNGSLVPLLMAALSQAVDRIDALTARVAELEAAA